MADPVPASPPSVGADDPAPAVRLGVLLIDSFDEPHRSVSGDYDRLYGGLFARAGAAVEMVDARELDVLPDPASLDGWVIGGSRQSVSDDLPWLRRLRDWTADVLEAEVPILGICFGHQLIADLLGGGVERWSGGWNIGAIDYELLPDTVVRAADGADALTGRGTFRLLASHRDQVMNPPPGAEVFATAPTCAIAGFTIGDHVTCVQGHPEFTTALAASLYRSRVELIGPTQVDAALGSMDRPCDGDAIAGWMVDRVRQSHRRT